MRRWREYRYRCIHSGLTHDQYRLEPRSTIDWDLAFAAMESQIEDEAIKKAQEGNGRG